MRALALVVALSSASAFAATAFWTGNQRSVTTVTGRAGVACEYSIYGNTFWRTFAAFICPVTIEVE